MTIRKITTLCSVIAMFGFSVAACAVDGTTEEPESSEGSDALRGTKPNKCITVRCTASTVCNPNTGACEPKPPTICQLSRCANGYHCEEPVGCVPNAPVECANVRCASGTKNIPGLGCCLKTCGGIRGARCDGTNVCVDDPTDNCDPKQGGADCGGVCVPPKEPADCRTEGCKAGSYCSGCRGASGGVFVCIPNGAVC